MVVDIVEFLPGNVAERNDFDFLALRQSNFFARPSPYRGGGRKRIVNFEISAIYTIEMIARSLRTRVVFSRTVTAADRTRAAFQAGKKIFVRNELVLSDFGINERRLLFRYVRKIDDDPLAAHVLDFKPVVLLAFFAIRLYDFSAFHKLLLSNVYSFIKKL